MPQALALVGIFDAAVCEAAERFYVCRKVFQVGFGCWRFVCKGDSHVRIVSVRRARQKEIEIYE